MKTFSPAIEKTRLTNLVPADLSNGVRLYRQAIETR